MFGRNKEKRTLDNRGKKEFEFDFQKEKIIYLYLWRLKGVKKKVKNLEGKIKFDKYEDWRQYVRKQYIDEGIERLKEFSRFLNQKIRNLEPNREYWNIFIPILSALVIETGFDEISKTKIDTSGSVFWVGFIAQMILTLIIIISMVIFIIKVVLPLWDNNIEKNFLEDYKEIIDEIIEEKTGNGTVNNIVPQHKKGKKSNRRKQ